MALDPQVVAALRRYAPQSGDPMAFVAAALVESGFNPRAIGDGGNSVGLFQENIRGRGAGLSVQARQDPEANAQRAAREFAQFHARGARGAQLAYRAQRPADQAGYIRKVNAAMADPRIMEILRGQGTSEGGAGVGDPVQAGLAPPLQAGGVNVQRLMALLAADERDILAGRQPDRYREIEKAIGTGAGPLAQVPAGIAGRAVAGAGQAVGKGLVPILPTPLGKSSYGYQDPEGQGGRHLAQDWFAPAGTPAVSPVTGRVVRYSPDPSPGRKASGQVFGGTVAVRDAQGRLFVLRHLTPGQLRVGQNVRAGQPLGVVKDWAGSPHIHAEAYGPGSGDREYSPERALNIYDLFAAGIR